MAAACGHDPREARGYPMRDLEALAVMAIELFAQPRNWD